MTNKELTLVKNQLDAINGGRWAKQYLELQDEGDSLLVSIEIGDIATQREIEDMRSGIRRVLNLYVPARSDGYSWTVAIKKNGNVVDSLMGGALGGLPEI